MIDLAGTVVLNYDVSGPADLMSSTAISVFVSDDMVNGSQSGNSTGLITIVEAGNVKSGVFDLDDGTEYLNSRDVSVTQKFSGGAGVTGDNFVTVSFKFTHASTDALKGGADFAIAADFCNFDQNNGSLTLNCIYRL